MRVFRISGTAVGVMLFSAAWFPAHFAEAQVAGSVVLPPNTPPTQQLFACQDLPCLFNAAFKTAIVVGGILAVIRLVYAGAVYMTTDLPGAKGNAKTIIGEAMTGLLLLLAVWLILYQINPQILNLNILANLPNAPPTVVAPPPDPPDGSYCYPAPLTGALICENTFRECMDSRAPLDRLTGRICTLSPPSDYTMTLSPTPLQGYHCFRNSDGLHGCFTHQGTCNYTADRQNTTCTFTP